jgi:2-keto-4-pentenoate hydratase
VTPPNVATAVVASPAGPAGGLLRHSGDQLALTAREHRRLADVLLGAARAARAIPRLTDAVPELTLADACRIRDMLLARRVSEGDELIGAKAWVGGAPAARFPRASGPQLGWLTDRMLLSGRVVDVSRLIRPRAEPRLAFVLGRPLRGPIVAASDLLAATEHVLPCLEIVGSRYDGVRPRLADVVADNCFTGALVLGDCVPPPADGHLRRLRVRLQVDGATCAPASVGAHAVVPTLDAATWLANQLLRAPNRTARGTHLISPVAGGPVELAPGVRVAADFRGIGGLELETVGAGRVVEPRRADRADAARRPGGPGL